MPEPEPSERPANLPAEAKWEPSAVPGFEWKQYALDGDGNKHGVSRSWTRDGVLHGEATYEHGNKHGPNKNFHPDGSVSSVGDWRDDVQYDCIYYRCDAPSTEPWPGDAGKEVRSVGFYSRDGKTNYTVRYFDASGAEIAMTGTPLPPRPDGVLDSARWFPDRKEWVDGAVARANNKQVGPWRWWTADGQLRHEEQRDDRGEARVTTDFHRGGNVSERRSKLDDGGELWEVFHVNGVQKINKHTDGKKRELYLGRWGDDGAMWDEKTVAYDADGVTSVTERDRGGVLAFDARREGAAIACRLYTAAGKLAASGMLRDGKLDGTWQLMDGDRVRREIDATPFAIAHKKPTGEGLLWRLGDALYRSDEPTFATPELLQGVDDVAWDGLETAYGSAKGFERYLRGVVAPDPLVRMFARGKLAGQIEHQGSTYPSTAAVIAWFAKLLAHPDADRHAMVAMIRQYGEAALPYLDEVTRDDEAWPSIGGVIEAVHAAWPAIFALFGAGDAQLRREIVVIGKAVPEARDELREVSRRDPDPAMRACAIDALVATKDYALDDVAPALADDDPLVRAVAAISIGQTRGPDASDAVVTALGQAIGAWRTLADRWAALPFTDGHVLVAVALATGSIRTPAARALAPELCASLDEVDGRSAIGYGQGLLALAFGRGERPFAPQFIDILEAVTRSRKFWTFNVNAYEVLDNWNLPHDQRALETLLGELRAASDPEALLRDKLDIVEPSEQPDEEDDAAADEEAEAAEQPAPDPNLATLARFAEPEHTPELCAKPDAIAYARTLIEAVPESDRQRAAQYVEQIAGEALRYALERDPERIIDKVAVIAHDLFELARGFDQRPEWSRVWPISESHAEPALFALAAGRYERAEELAREQLRDSRTVLADNHAVQLVFARAAAGLPPADDIVLADAKYDTRTYNRLGYWLAKQPLDVIERIVEAVPPETRLEIFVSHEYRITRGDNAIVRLSQPMHRLAAAMAGTLDRVVNGLLPTTIGGNVSPLADLFGTGKDLRQLLETKLPAPADDDERRALGRTWQLYSYLLCATQRFGDEHGKHVRRAIDHAIELGIADADWVSEVTAQLDRDALDPAFAAPAAEMLQRIASAGAIAGRSVGEFAETLSDRARARLLELCVEHAPALAWPVVAAMSDGAQRWRQLAIGAACPEVPGAFHALQLLGDGEIMNRLVRDAKTARDVPALVARGRSWLAILHLYGQRLLPDRIVEYAEALLARPEVVVHLEATEPDHLVLRQFSIARQPLAVVLAYVAQRAVHKNMPDDAVALCKVALRFPRARGEAARTLLALADNKAISVDDPVVAAARDLVSR